MNVCARNTTRSWALSLASGSHIFTHTPLVSLLPGVEWERTTRLASFLHATFVQKSRNVGCLHSCQLLSEARRALGAIALRDAEFAASFEHCPHPSASELADC